MSMKDRTIHQLRQFTDDELNDELTHAIASGYGAEYKSMVWNELCRRQIEDTES